MIFLLSEGVKTWPFACNLDHQTCFFLTSHSVSCMGNSLLSSSIPVQQHPHAPPLQQHAGLLLHLPDAVAEGTLFCFLLSVRNQRGSSNQFQSGNSWMIFVIPATASVFLCWSALTFCFCPTRGEEPPISRRHAVSGTWLDDIYGILLAVIWYIFSTYLFRKLLKTSPCHQTLLLHTFFFKHRWWDFLV